MVTDLLYIFVVLCIVGLVLWGIGQVPGVPPIVKTVVYVVVGVILLLWVLQSIHPGSLTLPR